MIDTNAVGKCLKLMQTKRQSNVVNKGTSMGFTELK
jgi:hypothetical protein